MVFDPISLLQLQNPIPHLVHHLSIILFSTTISLPCYYRITSHSLPILACYIWAPQDLGRGIILGMMHACKFIKSLQGFLISCHFLLLPVLLTCHPLLPTIFFTTVYNFTGISMLLLINRLADTYGFFDGNVKRDVIPDARLNETMLGVVVLTVMRPVVGTLILWNEWASKGGASGWDLTQWSWWALGLPFRLFLCSVVMDFWF